MLIAEALRERLIASGKGRIKEVYLLGEDYGGFIIREEQKSLQEQAGNG